MTPDNAAAMLDLFYPMRRRNDSDVLPCVGLGLGFCRELLERQEGTLTFEVEESGLSRIRVRLPVSAVSGRM